MNTLPAEIDRLIEDKIAALIESRFKSLLDDVAWRIRTLTDLADKIPAEGLNLQTHMITGYTIENNQPSAGRIKWADLYVVYQGQQYGPFSGDTDMTYVWFDFDHATNKIQTTNTKPTLAKDDAIIFVNNGGTAVEVLKSQLVSGKLIIDGSINSDEIASAAVTAAKILDGAVTTGKIGSGAVTEAKIDSGAVTEAKIASAAVTNAKIAAAAVATTNLQDGAVATGKIADTAVTTGKIANSAVDANKIANSAVTNTKIANSAVDSSKLVDGAVTTTKIADGAVGGAKIVNGGIDTNKLNILQHLIF